MTLKRSHIVSAVGFVAAALLLLVLSSCGGKGMEPFQDANITERNDSAARVGTMPDGFSNFAAKCDGPNMVYVIFKGDNAYGSLEVVPNDPRCE